MVLNLLVDVWNEEALMGDPNPSFHRGKTKTGRDSDLPQVTQCVNDQVGLEC